MRSRVSASSCGRHEDDGNRHPVPTQTLLELEPARTAQMDIEDQAGGPWEGQRLEELAGGAERRDRVPDRFEQTPERAPDRRVVVDNGDEGDVVHSESCLERL